MAKRAAWHSRKASALLGVFRLDETAWMPVAALFIGAFLVHPGVDVAAQRVVSIPDQIVCPRCVIEFDTVATIGGLDDPGSQSVSEFSKVAVDATGRILVSGWPATEISVFDSDGSFLRTVGQSGQGPGEYGIITHINVSPRFIHVFDETGRRTLLDYEFNVVRTDRVNAAVVSSAVMGDDALIFFASVPTERAAGHPAHILGADGEIYSFGSTGSVSRRRQAAQFVSGSSEAVWMIEGFRSRIVKWGIGDSPAPIVAFERAVAWFDDEDTMAWPRSEVRGILQEPFGLLVAGQAPDPKWADRWIESRPLPPNAPREIYDGWLDLIDPETGSTIARRRSDQTFLGFTGGSGHLVIYREDDDGAPFIVLVKLRFAAPPPIPSYGGIR